MLASKLSQKVTIEDLKNTIALIEAHKQAGHKASNIDDLNKELLYIKNTLK
jgi:tRNA(Phe) wybutosine-synthesizing methylase Tyw3